MLKDIVHIENSLLPDKHLSLRLSLYEYMSSNATEQDKLTHSLYDLLLDSLDKQSTVRILNTEILYITDRLHINLSRFHHLLLSISVANSKANNNTEELIALDISLLTGDLSVIINITKKIAQIELPDWIGYVESPDYLYLPKGVISKDSPLYKTFKYKEKFSTGLRIKYQK